MPQGQIARRSHWLPERNALLSVSPVHQVQAYTEDHIEPTSQQGHVGTACLRYHCMSPTPAESNERACRTHVAFTHQHRLWLYQVVAIWVELQADVAVHVCRVDVHTLAAVYGTALPHHHVATILHSSARLWDANKQHGINIHEKPLHIR